MKRFLSGMRTVLLWIWFAVFIFLLVIIMVMCEEHQDVRWPVALEIAWAAFFLVAAIVCETAAEKIRHILLIGKIRGYRKTELVLENEKFGRLTFYHYRKSGTLVLKEPKLSGFGEDEIELTVCHYFDRNWEDKFFYMLEQLYSRQEEIRKGLCRCVLKLYETPIDEQRIDERLHIKHIVIDLDEMGTEAAVVYVDMNSKVFESVCTERINVSAGLDCDTGEIRYRPGR